jgi:hypothetical protein
MRKLGIVVAGVALAAAGASVGGVSRIMLDPSTDNRDLYASDREAPRIMLDPSADNTDVYT